MASNKRGKRKSGSKDLIFEVSDGELSAEECDSQPPSKVMKFREEELVSNSIEISNIQKDNPDSSIVINVSDEETVIDISKFERSATLETTDSGICNSQDQLDLSQPLKGNLKNDSEDVLEVIKINDTNNEIHLDNTEVIYVESDGITEDSIDNALEVICDDTQKLEDIKSPKKLSLEDEEGEATKCVPQNKTDSGQTDTSTTICISFNNKESADLYKFKFIKFLETFVELETIFEDDLTIKLQRDSLLSPSEWLVLDETYLSQNIEDENLASPLPVTPQKKKKKKKKEKKEKDLFVLDTTPARSENSILSTLYSSKFEISERNEDDEVETNVKVKQAIVCFNCGDAHALRECPQKKNYAKIQAARMKMSQRQNSRYHLEPDQVYAHLRAGKISDKLREALDLRKNELPPYIYQMRVLGYPPGWLEEAKVVYSNLDLFDIHGNNVRQRKKTQGLDGSKIVEYPGFNVPMEKHVKDAYKSYRVPQYSEVYNKNAMIAYFEKQFENLQDNFDTPDMDLDNTPNEKNVSGPKQENESLPLKHPKIQKMKDLVEVGSPSPSLTDLEKQKERLLAALEENVSSNITSEENTNEAPEKLEEDENAEAAQKERKVINCEESPVAKVIRQSNFGTPILKSNSPYSKLPHLNNFTKDVACTLLHFENLPNSTGKYEKMREILKKVRDNVKDSQKQS